MAFLKQVMDNWRLSRIEEEQDDYNSTARSAVINEDMKTGSPIMNCIKTSPLTTLDNQTKNGTLYGPSIKGDIDDHRSDSHAQVNSGITLDRLKSVTQVRKQWKNDANSNSFKQMQNKNVSTQMEHQNDGDKYIINMEITNNPVKRYNEPEHTSTTLAIAQKQLKSKAEQDLRAVKVINDTYDSLDIVPRRAHIEMNGTPPSGSPRLGMEVSNINEGADPQCENGNGVFDDDIQKNQKPMVDVSDQDIIQVEHFFKSHKTEVIACQGLANLYFGTMKSAPNKVDTWKLAHSGIPVLVLDTGEKHRSRSLHLILAEKGTGFILFKDMVNHLTRYKVEHPNFHTMHISVDHSRVAGFSFDDTFAAAEFHRVLNEIMSDPDDDILNVGKSTSKSKKRKELEKTIRKNYKNWKAPKKSDISQPCCFSHVTKLESCDREEVFTLSSLVHWEESSKNNTDNQRTRQLSV